MFVDYVKLTVKAGDGGNGIVAFRREKYVPNGGPAGGNGGPGGNVVFKVDEGLSTLVELRYNRLLKAKNGVHGGGSGMHGKKGEDLIVHVPPGTVVKNLATGLVIADLIEHEDQAIIAVGGQGGRGNKAFKSNRNKTPKFAENGGLGQELEIVCELKLLADVGIVGFPSVGKSTFISVVTNVKPKIAEYPFTTIIPNIGVVKTNDEREFVMADLPGLIKGASNGHGLGLVFLRHIERTSVICHMIDMSGSLRDPIADYKEINEELFKYDESLRNRPQVVVANKMDLPSSRDNLERFKEVYPDLEVFELTAITSEGAEKIIYKLADLVDRKHRFSVLNHEKELAESKLFKYENEDEFFITRDDDGAYRISGKKIEELYHKTNFEYDEAALKFARILVKMGVEDELMKAGCSGEDRIRIVDMEFTLFD